jgi:hypothetical protein
MVNTKATKADAKAKYAPRTAQDEMAVHADKVDVHSAKAAEEAGVTAPEYVDYEAALENYEARSDVETLAQRRARESGVSFADADFRRKGEGNAVTTSPKDDNEGSASK